MRPAPIRRSGRCIPPRIATPSRLRLYDAITSKMGFAFVDRATGALIGSSRYHGYEPELGQIEIGWTFLPAHIGAPPQSDFKMIHDQTFDFLDARDFAEFPPLSERCQDRGSHSTVKRSAADHPARSLFAMRVECVRDDCTVRRTSVEYRSKAAVGFPSADWGRERNPQVVRTGKLHLHKILPVLEERTRHTQRIGMSTVWSGPWWGLRIEASVTKEDEMRSDRYQERARALAIEAGLDPDFENRPPWTTADADMVHVPRRRA